MIDNDSGNGFFDLIIAFFRIIGASILWVFFLGK